jgi:hypothetical protein
VVASDGDANAHDSFNQENHSKRDFLILRPTRRDPTYWRRRGLPLPGFATAKVFVADLNLFVYPCCGRARAASICILP